MPGLGLGFQLLDAAVEQLLAAVPAGPGAGVDDLLLETGDHLLLESGDAILLE